MGNNYLWYSGFFSSSGKFLLLLQRRITVWEGKRKFLKSGVSMYVCLLALGHNKTIDLSTHLIATGNYDCANYPNFVTSFILKCRKFSHSVLYNFLKLHHGLIQSQNILPICP